MSRQLHLNLFIQSRGHHEASWRHPDAADASITDVRYYQRIAQRAEEGLFDSIFFADQLALSDDAARTARVWLDPVTLLPAIAMATSRIGMVATASSTYWEPFNLARQFASIDHISGGRAAWNIVTSWLKPVALNFGKDPMGLGDRYTVAEEFVQIVKDLWDSWADDAVRDDRAAGVWADPARITPIDFEGEYYSCAGPLNLPRSPQGRPVLVQAGQSDAGRGFAARHAEAIFTAHLNSDSAREFYADVKRRIAGAGRNPDQVLVLPGINPMIADTEAEAIRLMDSLNDLNDPEIGRRTLSARFGGYDFSGLPLDRVLTRADFPDPETVEASRSRAISFIDQVEREGLTLRQLLARLAGARGHFSVAGTPEQIADIITDWYENGAADGFNVMPPLFPTQLDAFIEGVIPILQKRGLFRTAYAGSTLREHYGLERPQTRFWH
jgi:FMN-dependent oxidoreductase (nitrilotriacetate monooxygenase family)